MPGKTVAGERLSNRHISGLDGVRGAAILLVMLGHGTSYGGMTSTVTMDALYRQLTEVGWIGVTLFFVLSGFLITGILLDTKECPGYFRVFYTRRALRIFPLYYAYLAAVFVLMPILRPSDTWTQDVATHQAWYWTYLSNELFARNGFPPGGAGNLLGGFWSLAVEEQFYLVWPLLVWLLGQRGLGRTAALLIPGSLLLRVWYHAHGRYETAYVLTICRVDALAMGALVAIAVREGSGMDWVRRHLGRVGLTLVGVLMAIAIARGGFRGGDPWVGTIGYSLLAAFFAWILIVVLEGSAQRVASSSFLRFFGKYSYALYVVHAGVMLVLMRMGVQAPRFLQLGGSQMVGQLVFTMLAIALSVGLAMITWRLLEQPALSLKQYMSHGAPGVPAINTSGSSAS